jgi:hypothetical protein
MRARLVTLAALLAAISVGCSSGALDPRESPTTTTAANLPLRGIGPVFWYDLTAKTDDKGALSGYVLTSGRLGAKANPSLDLPTLAWASGPVRGGVLVGSDDGHRSTVQVVGPPATARLWTSDDIVWRGVLMPDGAALLALLTRDTREDAGIVRLGADGQPVQVVKPALPPSFGRTWSEELFLSPRADVLAVQECAPDACRSRFYDIAGGFASMGIAEGDACQLIGVTSTQFAAFGSAACLSGRPADVLVGTIGKGTPAVVGNGDSTRLFGEGQAVRLAIGAETPNGYRLQSVSLDGRGAVTVPVPAGFSLVAQPEANGSSYALPDGWIAAAPGGQMTPDGLGASFLNPATGASFDSRSVAP